MARRTWAAVLATVAVVATTLTGCSGGGSDSNTLRVVLANFSADNEGQAVFDDIVEIFHESYPEVRVEADFVPYDNLNAKIATSLAAGTTYDVISAGVGWIQPLAGLGAIGELEGEGFGVEELEDRVYPSFVPPMLHEGKVYGVPIVANPRVLAYSRSAFEAAGLDPGHPPRTFEELREDAERLTVREDGRITQTGFDFWAQPSNYRQQFVAFLGAAGGTLFDGTEPLFDSPEGVRALSTMRDMVSVDRSSQYGYQNTAQTSLVTAGQAGMGFASPYVDCSDGDGGIGAEKCDDLVYFSLQDEQSSMFTGGRIAAMGSQTELEGPAKAFIRALSAPSSQEAISVMDVGVPVDVDSADSDFVQGNPASRYAVEHLDTAIMEYGGTNFLEFRAAGGWALDEAILDRESPADALTSLAELARNRT
ncbi:extracellular solute-binding protein [Streptomyces sp. SBT349]|uniref:extracellular solute-binding protein n=1 Tax=Streptomyces sp. SBT349 TaxID=1580539 RepID=UPI00066CE8EA|nr:extracellular solute-binding protein [Streptomyces sp. SBT349]